MISIIICHPLRKFVNLLFLHSFFEGEFDSFVFKYSICSADMHGYHIHVPCEAERIDEILREKYPGNYMISNAKGYGQKKRVILWEQFKTEYCCL